MANVSITQLPTAQTLDGTEAVPIVQKGVTVQTTTYAIANSPVLTQTFLTVGAQPSLGDSRYFTVGPGMAVVDGGPSGPFSANLVGAPLSLVSSPLGFQVKTATNTLEGRAFQTGNGLAVTNPDGIDGDPVFTLTGIAAAIAGSSGTGMLAIVDGTAIANRTIEGTVNQINVTDGNGAGNPTIALADDPVIPGVAGVVVPVGTNAERASFPSEGTLRYNSQAQAFEGYTSSGWGTIVAGSAITLINTGTGLTGGPITSSGTISIADTAVTPGAYGTSTQVGQFTVNAQGQITAASNVAIDATGLGLVASVTGTANEITSTGTTNVVLSLPNALTFTGKTVTDGTFNMAAATVNAGTVTTNTALQTLTNKTLTSPTINTPALSGGSINNTIIGASVPAAATFTLATLTSGTVATAPTNGLDIVNKDYADSIASGLNYHQPVVYASTAALPTYTYSNGTSGVGATITATANGALSIGGGSPTTTQRVLVKDEAGGNAAYNGVYTVTATGSPTAVFQLTRATDYDSSGTGTNEIDAGDYVLVISGTNASTAWVQQTPLPIVVGTTPLVFLQFNQPITYSAGTGLNLSPATTFNISNTGVTAATYGAAATVPVFAVNAQGQVTSVTDTAIAIANTAVSGLGTMSTQAAGAVAITGGSIDNTTIGATTASTGAFTTLSATGQLVSTQPGSSATNAGQLYLNGAISNRIDWNTEGVSAPATTTRSAGTKLTLYPALSGSQVDYAIGINAATLWSSIPVNSTSFYFRWYGGTTEVASLDGIGNFVAAGDITTTTGTITAAKYVGISGGTF